MRRVGDCEIPRGGRAHAARRVGACRLGKRAPRADAPALHGDPAHLVGNMAFGAFFGYLAGLAGGAGLNRLGGVRPEHARLQALAGAGAVALLALVWWRVL